MILCDWLSHSFTFEATLCCILWFKVLYAYFPFITQDTKDIYISRGQYVNKANNFIASFIVVDAFSFLKLWLRDRGKCNDYLYTLIYRPYSVLHICFCIMITNSTMVQKHLDFGILISSSSVSVIIIGSIALGLTVTEFSFPYWLMRFRHLFIVLLVTFGYPLWKRHH